MRHVLVIFCLGVGIAPLFAHASETQEPGELKPPDKPASKDHEDLTTKLDNNIFDKEGYNGPTRHEMEMKRLRRTFDLLNKDRDGKFDKLDKLKLENSHPKINDFAYEPIRKEYGNSVKSKLRDASSLKSHHSSEGIVSLMEALIRADKGHY
ncbi:hypothetical protein F5148DRAFT_1227353 [Russula earlei]|uniref:Uncharacterized protein n=1 Tax=Russula earlei TaxID=71964 RepID=A0ACC0TZK8_9AGAM|nr:hypothetical protein F5148DRAFT_1227353 [Russula earlei]